MLRDLFQVLEVADRAQVVEALVLEHREAGRVIASILEALEAMDQKGLRPARSDVSDDPAHVLPQTPFLDAKSPAFATPNGGGRLTELSSNEVGDASTESC